MSITPMDLDSSLDDLIKKRRDNKPQNKRQFQKSHKEHNNGKNNNNKQPLKSRLSVQSKGKISKPSQPQRSNSGINSRLSTSTQKTVSGPLFTSKNQQQQQQQQQRTPKTDPSQIIITKAFSPSSVQSRVGNNNNSRLNSSISSRLGTENNNNTNSILHGRLGNNSTTASTSNVQSRVGTTSFTRSATAAAAANPTSSSTAPLPDFSIRGRSSTVKPSTGMAITGESGPTLLLITGLDVYANSEDLETSLEVFGHILSCEVLRNRDGRSYGEAEVEFSTRKAALDCIARLNNQMADGRILRVILRENNKYNAPKPVQSVISTTTSYTPSGKMYADQMSPRYDIRRQ